MILRQLYRWSTLLPLPAITVEMIWVHASSFTSVACIGIVSALSFLARGRLVIRAGWLGHLVLFLYFLAIALLQPVWERGTIERYDLLNGFQALLLAPVLAGFLEEPGAWAWWSRWTARAVAALGGGAAIAGLVKFWLTSRGTILWPLVDHGEYPPWTSLRVDYNIYALAVCFGMAAGLWLREQMDEPRAWRWTWTALIVPMLPAIVFSGSRRGVLFMVAVMVLSFFVGWKPAKKRRGWLLPTLAMGGIAVMLGVLFARAETGEKTRLFYFIDLGSAVRRLAETRGAGGLVESRVPLMIDAWTTVQNRSSPGAMLFGRGFSYLREMGRQFPHDVEFEYPHNFVLSALLHGGVLFATGIVIAVGATFIRAWRLRRELAWMFSVLFIGCAFTFSSAASIYSSEQFVILMVLVAVMVPGAVTPVRQGQ